MRRVVAVLVGILLTLGCTTAPEGEGGESLDRALLLPPLPESAQLELSAETVELSLEDLDPELQERLEAGKLSLEARYTSAQAAAITVVGEYANDNVEVPLSGLSPGETYALTLRLRSSEEVGPYSGPVSLSLPPWDGSVSLSLVDPIGSVTFSEEPLRVVDTTPQFSVAISGTPLPVSATWGLLGGSTSPREVEIRDGRALFELDEAVSPGPFTLELALAFENGLLLSPAGRFEFLVDDPEPPRATAHGGGLSVVERPALRWEHQPGVEAYEVAFLLAPAGFDPAAEGGASPGSAALAEELADAPTETVAATALVIGGDLLSPGRQYLWRVRPLLGELPGPWSEAYTFLYEPVSYPFASVIEAGERVTYTQGNNSGSGDEGPPREVELTLPFDIATREMTNSMAAALLNSGLLHGRFRQNGLVIETAEEGVPLVHFDTLEYGEQIGLAFAPEIERVSTVTGRANHPAVGITWHGANALADELTLLDGRSDEEGGWRYRLPSEAEWEYAANGGTGRTYPWGNDSPRGRANYYRSGDAYEDVNPPYTRNGGPTTPVGYFATSSPFGTRDLIGNVWEWCLDWYDPNAYVEGAAIDPRGAAEPVPDEFGVAHRSLRGLAWNSRVEDVRIQNRGKFPPESSSWSIGIRLVRNPR